MTREDWLRAWGYVDGTPEAASAWEAKQAFEPRSLNATIMSDIGEYHAMGTDVATGDRPMITSRSHHRDYLKRNGYMELGNEMPTPRKALEPDRREIGRQIKHVIDSKGIRL